MTTINTLLLIGAGRMGSALLEGWQRDSAPTIGRFLVVDPQRYQQNSETIFWYKTPDELPADLAPDVVVFAIKPQEMKAQLATYKARFSGKDPLYISIAAGKTLKFLTKQLGKDARIVRGMPNLAALVGRGMTVLVADKNLPESARHTASALMHAVGKVEWAEEALMDTVTAISGSGPAYVFLFLESLVNAGIEAKLPHELAETLALETVAGSCALADEHHESLEELRQNVTSPGGTTEAALKVLMRGKALEKLMKKAVKAAAKRSRKLKE
jgi:pyrroline-5-carboxylate reductase